MNLRLVLDHDWDAISLLGRDLHEACFSQDIVKLHILISELNMLARGQWKLENDDK